MPLDDLVSVIETLQQRIKEHGHALNETQTRTALIDPLLTALGWDVSDPGIVTPEYRTDVGWADYALRGPGNKPSAVVEAKRLGSFVENHLDQAVTYCIQQGIAYAAVTDGNHWQMYRTFEPVPLLDKRVLDVQIGNTPAFECALKFLLLWRPNLASGRPVEASEPVLSEANTTSPSIGVVQVTPSPASMVIEDQHVIPQVSALPSGEEWINLSEYRPKPGDAPPSAIRFSTSEERHVGRHKNLLIEVAEYLVRRHELTAQKCPIGSGRVKYLVNSVQEHKDGSSFRDQHLLSNGLHLETKDPAPQTANSARFLLRHFGQDPSAVFLRVG